MVCSRPSTSRRSAAARPPSSRARSSAAACAAAAALNLSAVREGGQWAMGAEPLGNCARQGQAAIAKGIRLSQLSSALPARH